MTWQDIESASKDGTVFLGYGKDVLGEKDEIITMLWWGGGCDADGYEFSEGFFALGQFGVINGEHRCNPTHWTDLPLPPVKKHYCENDAFVCKERNGRLTLRCKIDTIYFFCDYCPMCGETA